MHFEQCLKCGGTLSQTSKNLSTCDSCATQVDDLETNTAKNLNIYAWLMMLVPLSGIASASLFHLDLTILPAVILIISISYLIVWLLLGALDVRKIRASGYTPPSMLWLVLLPPIYMWKRASAIDQSRKHFWILSLSIMIGSSVSYVQAKKFLIETAACQIVTNIIEEHTKSDRTCKTVALGREITNNYYQAKAILDNGNELTISIEKLPADQIKVQIPEQRL